jgi:hypothetical protein
MPSRSRGKKKNMRERRLSRERRTAHYSMMKQLTISGYFTSEAGRKGALRYKPIPGSYNGNLDYKKGDKAFAGLD